MKIFPDINRRKIRLTDEREEHFLEVHPEMNGQIDKIQETLEIPDKIIRSKTASNIEMFYKNYKSTPVTNKFLCVIVKVIKDDLFIITAYFTNTIKKGEELWIKK
ncbi:MAG: hypothetical protein ABII90_11380 [Bacteroidota bacterium]